MFPKILEYLSGHLEIPFSVLSISLYAPEWWHIVIDLSVRQSVRLSFFVRSITLKLCKAST